MVVTFYSFKGGVGRSMAMANVATILADLGYNVLACDWDLEAPGLERYFADRKEEADRLQALPGLMDLLVEYKEQLTDDDVVEPTTDSTHARMGKLLVRRPSSRAVKIPGPRAGTLHLLTAGARGEGGREYSKYADIVRAFDWEEFYLKWAGGAYMDFLRADLAIGRSEEMPGGTLQPAADILLIDSRTGVTEHGGVATRHLADVVVLLSAANDLNLDGTRWMAEALDNKDLVARRSNRPLDLIPVPTRIELSAEKELLEAFQARFVERFCNYLPGVLGSATEFFRSVEIPYIPFYSFTERVAAREAEGRRHAQLYRAYEALAHSLIEVGVSRRLLSRASVPPSVRLRSQEAVLDPPRGVFAIYASPESHDVASALRSGLTSSRVTVATDDMASPNAGTPALAGAVLLVTPETPWEWVRAQVDEGLRQRSFDPGFRIVPVVAGDVPLTTLKHLSRLRTVTINADDPARGLPTVIAALAERTGVVPESSTTSPFPGAGPFSDAEARFFCGRDDDLSAVTHACRQVEQLRALQITGAVGSGRTSFVHAAIIPALRRGTLTGVPVTGPVVTVAGGAEDGIRRLSSLLSVSAPTVSEMVRLAVPPGQKVILVIDDINPGLWIGNAALSLAVGDDNLPLVVITTSVQEWPTGADGVVSHSLRPLDAAGWKAAVTHAPESVGLTWEPSAQQMFFTDVERFGSRPLMGPVFGRLLERLWEDRAGSVLTAAAYDRTGGPLGILLAEADKRIERLAEPDRRLAEGLLVALVPAFEQLPAELPRRRALALAGGEARGERLLADLAEAPALIRSDDTVALAHPELAQRWGRLREWVGRARETQSLRARRYWTRGIAAAAVLLVAITNLAQLAGTREADRIHRSEEFAEAADRVRGNDPLAAVAFAVRAGETAETDEARAALESIVAMPFPRAFLEHSQPVSDAVFASDARIISTTPTVLTIWSRPGDADGVRAKVEGQRGVSGTVTSLRIAPGSRHAGLTTFGGTALLLSVQSGDVVAELKGAHTGPILDSTFSPDGGRYVTAGIDGLALIWNTATGVVAHELRGHSAAVTSVVATPDGRRILTSSLDGTVRAWDWTGKPLGAPMSIPAGAEDAGFRVAAAGANAFAAGGAHGLLIQWGERDAQTVRNTDISAVAVAADGGLIAAVADTQIQVYRHDAPEPFLLDVRASQEDTDARVKDIAVDPKGQFIAAGLIDGRVFVWKVIDKAKVELRAHRATVNRVRFSDDGKFLLTAGEDNVVFIWDVAPVSPPADASFAALLAKARSVALRFYTPDEILNTEPRR